MPLLATVVSVGIVVAPPLLPGGPSSWASSAAAAPGGAGAGSEGAAPGPDTLTSNPGAVSTLETPFDPVTVTGLHKAAKITSSLPLVSNLTSATAPRMPIVADGVCIVIAFSCLLSLPPTKRNTPRVRLAASLPVPAEGS